MIFYFHVNKTHFLNKGLALSLVLKAKVFGTRKWPIRIKGVSEKYSTESSSVEICNKSLQVLYFKSNIFGSLA